MLNFRFLSQLGGVLILLSTISVNASADFSFPITSEMSASIGGRIAIQYYDFEVTEENVTESNSDTEIRRLRPYVKFESNDLRAKLSWELSDRNPNTIKDAYIEYRGFETTTIKFGNETAPFSRERMISSRTQQLPERGLIAENNWGTPTRIVGVHFESELSERFTLFTSLGNSDVYSDAQTEIRFLSPWRNHDLSNEQVNSGTMVVSRFDFNVGGGAKYRQSQLKQKNGLTASLAGFYWKGEEAGPTPYEFYEDIMGLEISAGWRYQDLSLDVQLQNTVANVNVDGYSDSVKERIDSSITRGIVHDNKADLTHFNIDSGYMILPKKLELAVGYGILQSESKNKTPSYVSTETWSDDWTYQELGINVFLNGYKHKIAASYREDKNIQGKQENSTTLILQWQYVY